MLNDLINKLCPNGVEYLPLWKITIWNKKFNLIESYKQEKVVKFYSISPKNLKKLLSNFGDVKLLSTGSFDGFTNEKNCIKINNAEVLTLPEGGKANIKYWNGKFINSLNLIATSANKNLYNLRYIYHFLAYKNELIEANYRGSGIKHPDMKQILEIPIPPLEIQNEIVNILDNFSTLCDDLTSGLPAEIEMRKKQYEYYRDQLLTFNEKKV